MRLYKNKSPLSYITSGMIGMTLLVLTACAAAPARDADTYYDLRPTVAPLAFGSTKILKIQSVTVKGLQSGRPLIFEKSTNPVQYQEARGHLWHLAPSSLIETALANALTSASQDLIIGTADTIDNEDLRLKLVVSKFHFAPDHSAYLSFDAIIKDKRGKILSSTSYDIVEPLNASGYEAAVLALEAALSAGITAMSADIASAL